MAFLRQTPQAESRLCVKEPMKSIRVELPPLKKIIQPANWDKKRLADAKLDALLYCEFGCPYCSSNSGMHLRMKKHTIQSAVSEITDSIFNPHDAGNVVIAYKNLLSALDRELDSYADKPGNGETLVYSKLTDGFSPVLLMTGTARSILEKLIEKTKYRIRVLTKNAIVGRPEWTRFFSEHADRFVVGLSIGTLNDAFAKKMEWRTSTPTARVKALHQLQDAGVPTFGMMCPVFPQVVETDELERLVESIRPELCEHVWAEPYNDRHNWKGVRDVYKDDAEMWEWMTKVYQKRDLATWSKYATDLYVRIHDKAVNDGWSDKLRYLLYEADITATDALNFGDLDGVLLQSKTGDNGQSKNPAFAESQSEGLRVA